jgi:uncharacterized membrane protein
MDPAVQPIASARGARILHAALVIGSILAGVTFFFVLRVIGPSFGNAPLVGYLTAGLGLANLAFALGFFRSKIPQRPMDQAPDDYWMTNEARAPAVIVWAMVESAGLLSWIGYLLTGGIVPAAVAVLSIVSLIMLRPSQLEGNGAA